MTPPASRGASPVAEPAAVAPIASEKPAKRAGRGRRQILSTKNRQAKFRRAKKNRARAKKEETLSFAAAASESDAYEGDDEDKLPGTHKSNQELADSDVDEGGDNREIEQVRKNQAVQNVSH